MSVPDRSHIDTEGRNPASAALDAIAVAEAVAVMHAADLQAVAAVGRVQREITQAVQWAVEAFRAGGRLVYAGAGTSGRLGVLDASECPPTFCTPPEMVVGVIAGGDAALRRSIEGAEDDPAAGAAEMRRVAVAERDLVVGIAAGGTTPFVHGALQQAKAAGARTVFLACTQRRHIAAEADLFICLETGPEVLTGSTRLKAGTATKLVLNTITTVAMANIGKVYGNLMVDIDSTRNAKLVDRAARVIGQLTGLQRDAALRLLEQAGGKVKRAVVMHRRGCDAAAADQLLAAAGGNLRAVFSG